MAACGLVGFGAACFVAGGGVTIGAAEPDETAALPVTIAETRDAFGPSVVDVAATATAPTRRIADVTIAIASVRCKSNTDFRAPFLPIDPIVPEVGPSCALTWNRTAGGVVAFCVGVTGGVLGAACRSLRELRFPLLSRGSGTLSFDTPRRRRENALNGGGWFLVGPLVFKTSVGREERPGCVRFAHASAIRMMRRVRRHMWALNAASNPRIGGYGWPLRLKKGALCVLVGLWSPRLVWRS